MGDCVYGGQNAGEGPTFDDTFLQVLSALAIFITHNQGNRVLRLIIESGEEDRPRFGAEEEVHCTRYEIDCPTKKAGSVDIGLDQIRHIPTHT